MSGVATPMVCEVGPRDGLQNESVVLDPAVRAELCTRLAATGVRRIEATSFVHPGRVPAMAGAEEVLESYERPVGVQTSALVLNPRGLDRALQCELDVVNIAYPVTGTFCRRNQNVSLETAAADAAAMVRVCVAAGTRVSITLAAAFGCPFEGEVDPGHVLHHVRAAAAAGADEIVLADTIGVGSPRQVRTLLAGAATAAPGVPVGLHLHNSRNTGYANAATALEHGVAVLDASVGGIGGCPFAPRATGNLATEDLLYLLEREGVEHGVDLDALFGVADWLAERLGKPLPGLVRRAGWFPAEPAW